MSGRVLIGIVVACALLAAPGSASAACPAKVTCESQFFTSPDGTELHVDVLRPTAMLDRRLPSILTVSPYLGHGGETGQDYNPTKAGPSERFKDMWDEGHVFERGYAVVQVDLRGYGASAGCSDQGGPGEQMDAKAAVEWTASQPWSTGKVGTWGKSYDGWTQMMELNARPKGLAAQVVMSPILNGYSTLNEKGVHYQAAWYSAPPLFALLDLEPPAATDDAAYVQGELNGLRPDCNVSNIVGETANPDEDSAFWKARDLPNLRGADVPELWSFGFLDDKTKPNNMLPAFSSFTGPKRAWYGQYTHVRPQDKRAAGSRESTVGREGFIDEAMRWMDRYVKGVPAAEAPVEQDPGVEVEDGATMHYRAEASWPPADAATHAMQITGGSVTNLPGTQAELVAPLGVWSVTTPLTHDVHLAGEPHLRFASSSSSRANVHGLLWDVTPDGKGRLVSRSAMAVEGTGTHDLRMYPQDWTFAKGHRLAFVLSPGDDDWFLATAQGATVAVSDARLDLPLLRFTRTSTLPSQPSVDELARKAPVDLSLRLGAPVAFDEPPELTTPPAMILPTTGTPRRLSVRLELRHGRLVAQGRAPAGQRLVVRLQRGGRTVQTRTVSARPSDRFTVRFRRVLRGGRFRALVSTQAAGTSVSVRSAARKLR